VDVTEAASLVDERMTQACVQHDIPIVSYGLLLGGALVHTGCVGALDAKTAPTTPFRIASMTKSFTAASVLQLRDAGALSLDTPLREVLPWAESIGLPASAPAMRIAHLLTMTAGFPTDDPWGDRHESTAIADFDAIVAGGLTLCRPPGIEFEYANIGYALLGRVIAQVTGTPYTDVVREQVLEPLGMRSTTFDARAAEGRTTGMHPSAAGLVEQTEGQPGAFSPMGGLWSTVADIARWVDFMESAWSDVPDDGVLSRWSRREMQRPHIVVGHEPDGAIDSYGMGLRITDHRELGRFVHHSGGYPGFGSHMRWHPDTRWGIVALANRTYAPMRPVAAQVLAEIVADEAAEAARMRAVERLWPQTERAMSLVESLLVQWDDTALDALAAVNLDLDQSRAERRIAWGSLDVKSLNRDSASVVSRSPAHAHWTVVTDIGPIELDVLLTGEREPRIQAMSARRG
jgi:CubicO group peptidase (beta-lactamase class C family)